ncbi:hypothetical protein [Curtobacterium sp. PhB115]|uniref:DUF6197 family protein n=1 Tax=Curtobacterium sp. PhB115 TaxID=2485173 RepID=UPI000F4D1C0B|nr:hypothetical protein [Curtobacterium sp. PhB115]ROP72521.1 hypothetical protein EDF19_1536 [Curtobacterium sp. PhB115]
MSLEFRVQHDVATDASPAPTRTDRTGFRGLLDRLAERRAAARVRRVDARLRELGELGQLLSDARGVIERGWIQHAWFAYLDEHGRVRKASSAAAMDVQGRPLVGACLVGAVVSAAGGPHAVHSPRVQHSLDLVWHALVVEEGSPVLWCPAPDIRMGRVRDLTSWNDSAARTSAEVAGLLLTAERVAVQESARLQDGGVARSRA